MFYVFSPQDFLSNRTSEPQWSLLKAKFLSFPLQQPRETGHGLGGSSEREDDLQDTKSEDRMMSVSQEALDRLHISLEVH